MKIDEAIAILEQMIEHFTWLGQKKSVEALDVAIYALKNIEKDNNIELAPETIIKAIKSGHLLP